MSRRRLCVLSLVETHSPATSLPHNVPGSGAHAASGVLLSRRIVMDCPYDPLFKDVQKACPHARFDGTTKTWGVEILNAHPGVVLNVLGYLGGAAFLTAARDRQFDIMVKHDLCVFANDLLTPGAIPAVNTLFNWTPGGVILAGSLDHYIACAEIPRLLADMGVHVAPAAQPGGYQHPAPYQPRKTWPATKHPPQPVVTPLPSSASSPPPMSVPIQPVIIPKDDFGALVEADEPALSGSYGEMDMTADAQLSDASKLPAGVADINNVPEALVAPDGTRRVLYMHQRLALARLAHKLAHMSTPDPIRMIVAHDPGLGKTTTAIAFAELHPMRAVPEHYAGKIKRIAVVCPERARTMWADTFHEWTNRKAFRYGVDNSAGKDWSETDDGVLIVGYASIIREGFVHRLGHAPFDGSLLIVDEAHYLSNNKSKRSIAVREIAKRFQYTLMLTGTPMLAHPIELYPLLNLCSPMLVNSYWQFATRFAGAHKTKFGWDVSGASNLPELTDLLARHMHRVRKSQADLPPKRRVLVPIDIEDRDAMEDEIAEATAGLTMPPPASIPGATVHGTGPASNLAVSGSIRQIVYNARRDETIEWIADWAKAQPDRKLLVFAWNRAAVEDLAAGIASALKLPLGSIAAVTGDTRIKDRDATVKLFNSDPKLRFLVATIASAGTVYDMHGACCDGVFAQCDWTPGTMIQAEDRLGRAPGGEPVTWYYLCAAGTVDERILKVLLKKQETFTQVVDGGEVPADYADVLHEILKWKAGRDVQKKERVA